VYFEDSHLCNKLLCTKFLFHLLPEILLPQALSFFQHHETLALLLLLNQDTLPSTLLQLLLQYLWATQLISEWAVAVIPEPTCCHLFGHTATTWWDLVSGEECTQQFLKPPYSVSSGSQVTLQVGT
jgi:hypothetical protein